MRSFILLVIMAIILLATGCSEAATTGAQSGGEAPPVQDQVQEHDHSAHVQAQEQEQVKEKEQEQPQAQVQEETPPVTYTLNGSVNEQYDLIIETNLTLSKENYSKSHRDGEGHVHLYVNGKLIGPIQDLEPYSVKSLLKSGDNTIKLVLASNNHNESIYEVSYVIEDVQYDDTEA